MKIVRCREEACQAIIVFLRNPKSGKVVPVDAESVDGEADEFEPDRGHISHFKTCIAPSGFSRGKLRRNGK